MLDRATADYDPAAGVTLPAETTGPASRFAVLDVLTLRNEPVDARERLREIGLSDRSSATMLSLAARIASNDPFQPETRREDDERRLVALAAARDPQAVWPAMRRAALESGEVESLAALREVAARFPQLATIQLELASALAEAGYQADADQAVARAQAAQPEACPVIAARYNAAVERGRVELAVPLARDLVACDARDETLFERALDRHDWPAATAELERLRPLLGRLARASWRCASRGRRARPRTSAASSPRSRRRRARTERHVAGRSALPRGGSRWRLRLVRDEAARAPRHAGDLRNRQCPPPPPRRSRRRWSRRCPQAGRSCAAWSSHLRQRPAPLAQSLFCHALRLFRGLSCGVSHTFYGLARRVPDALRRLASTFGSPPDTLASLLGRLARSCSGFLGRLIIFFFLQACPGTFAHLLGGLTSTRAHVLYRRFGTGTNVFYRGAGTLHCLTGARAHVFHGLARAFDGFAGARTDVLQRPLPVLSTASPAPSPTSSTADPAPEPTSSTADPAPEPTSQQRACSRPTSSTAEPAPEPTSSTADPAPEPSLRRLILHPNLFRLRPGLPLLLPGRLHPNQCPRRRSPRLLHVFHG